MARIINLHADIWRGCFATLRGQPLHKHPCGCSWNSCSSSSVRNILCEQHFRAFYGQKVQAAGPINFVRWFVWHSTENTEYLAINFLFRMRPASPGGLQHQKSCLGRNKPSCCIRSLPPPTMLCAWIFNLAFRDNSQLNAQIYRLFLVKTLAELLKKIPLGLWRDM